MRGIQLSLNKTQKLRLERALQQLESLSSKLNSNATVTVADSIPVNYEDGVLKYTHIYIDIYMIVIIIFFLGNIKGVFVNLKETHARVYMYFFLGGNS